nr:peptidoglycan editing factor PgeF [Leeia oryzae]
MLTTEHLIVPQWQAPNGVKALATTRLGGVSQAPFDALNLGSHVNDRIDDVTQNRHLLDAFLPASPVWLQQVHGIAVVDLDSAHADVPVADAVISRRKGQVCAVQTADCLPVLFADVHGTVVGAAHAGWRGLCHGVLEATLSAMAVDPADVVVWLGAAIGPDAFEVGDEVRAAFMAVDPAAAQAFVAGKPGKWLADIYQLARLRLQQAGVGRQHIFGGDLCTYTDRQRFFSYRRDQQTGRQASLVWLD